VTILSVSDDNHVALPMDVRRLKTNGEATLAGVRMSAVRCRCTRREQITSHRCMVSRAPTTFSSATRRLPQRPKTESLGKMTHT